MSGLKRISIKREQRSRILMVSEGEVTEKQYFSALIATKRLRSAQFVFLPPPPTSPIEIVKKAKAELRKAQRSDPFDSVWCVFDVESKVSQVARVGLNDAITMARSRPPVKIALSNPCFEIWLALHVEKHEAWIASDAIQARCKTLQITNGKHLRDPAWLVEGCPEARVAAEALEVKHDRENRLSAADRNPSSTVYCLIDDIDKLFPDKR